MSAAEIFQKLHQGRADAYGVYDPEQYKTGYKTINANLTLEHYKQHLDGKISLGVIPITSDEKCSYGIVDDDKHHNKNVKYDYKNLLQKIKILRLPVSVYKSKSGGAHIVVYLDKPYPAKDVRHILKKFAYQLCESKFDLFPRQDEVGKGTGSFCNLPYHNGNTRVLVDSEGKELSFDNAMLYASNRVVNLDELKVFKLLATKDFPAGRNNKLFSAKQFLTKHYPDEVEESIHKLNKLFDDPLTEKEVNATVLAEKADNYFDQDKIETPPTELIGHDIQEYRMLDIEKPNFILERLFKERSINFLFGEKGKGKSMFAIGLGYAMSHGISFLNYKTPYANPVIYLDGEMDPYDMIEREAPFLRTCGEAPKDYFHIINWYFQKNQNIPDIKEPIGQDLITNYCNKVKTLTGKAPFLILDNLRSLSNYVENDSDSWRPIGKWLLKLRGLGYSSLVLDHTGHGSSHMRGTSSKSDWANVCLKIESEGAKSKVMKVKLSFDKARGLKPDETDDFVAQYDDDTLWILGQSEKKLDQQETFQKILVILNDWKAERLKLYPKPKPSASEEERDQWFKNCYPNGNKMPTQDYIAKKLECSVGKCNGLMKKWWIWYEKESANGGQGKSNY